MCPDLVLRPAAVQLAIPGDIVMIADVSEPTILVCASKRFHGKIPVVACCAAMNYKEANLPVILVKAILFHFYSFFSLCVTFLLKEK